MAIGVAVSDSPTGPFRDALGHPLVENSEIDPTVFIDDDGQAYLYWGNPNLWYVKLNADMMVVVSGVLRATGVKCAAPSGSMVTHERAVDRPPGSGKAGMSAAVTARAGTAARPVSGAAAVAANAARSLRRDVSDMCLMIRRRPPTRQGAPNFGPAPEEKPGEPPPVRRSPSRRTAGAPRRDDYRSTVSVAG
ncbi:MAG: family 43 glycosylhydrolase [Streptomyces sp.]